MKEILTSLSPEDKDKLLESLLEEGIISKEEILRYTNSELDQKIFVANTLHAILCPKDHSTEECSYYHDLNRKETTHEILGELLTWLELAQFLFDKLQPSSWKDLLDRLEISASFVSTLKHEPLTLKLTRELISYLLAQSTTDPLIFS